MNIQQPHHQSWGPTAGKFPAHHVSRSKKRGWGTSVALGLAGLCAGFVAGVGSSQTQDAAPQPQGFAQGASVTPAATVTATATRTATATQTMAITETATTTATSVVTETAVVTKTAAAPAKPAPATQTRGAEAAYYATCAEAREAGVAPLRRGDAGYRSALDRDDDGVACE